MTLDSGAVAGVGTAYPAASIVPLGIVADDLTGALDATGPFAARGWPAYVLLGTWVPDRSRPYVVAASTESRMLHAPEAAERVLAAARSLNTPHLFKKMDSLLRGPFAAEIVTLVRERRPDLVLVAPAFPAQGRTTAGGVQYAHGHPVDAPTARDPFAPAGEADLCRALAGAGLSTGLLPLARVRARHDAIIAELRAAQIAGMPVVVADAERQQDLDALARAGVALGADLLWCGSAGLAAALAAILPRLARVALRHQPARALIVCGSLHPVTRAQVAYLRAQAGVATVTLDPAAPIDVPAMATHIISAFADASRVLVLLAAPQAPVEAGDRARTLALVEEMIRALPPDVALGLVATGGDIAAAVCRGLGLGMLEVQELIEHGISLSIGRGGPRDGLPIATKAGAFGDEAALWTAVHAVLERRWAIGDRR